MMKVKQIFLAVLLCMLFSACQPTPDTVSNSMSTDTWDGLDNSQKYIHHQDILHDGIQLCIDANITASNGFPYAQFTKREFSKNKISQIFYALCNDSQIFQCVDTKSQLEYSLLYYKSMISKDTVNDITKQMMSTRIDTLMEKMAEAPEHKPVASIDDILTYQDGIVEVGNSTGPNGLFQVLQTDTREQIYYEAKEYRTFFTDANITATPLTISQDDAVSQAEQLLKEINLDAEFVLAKCQESKLKKSFSDEDTETMDYYNLVFLRRVNQVEQSYSMQTIEGYAFNPYCAPFYHEYIEIKVNNSGILSFLWTEPGDLIIIDEQMSPIAFDYAFDILKKHMTETYNQYYFKEVSDIQNVCIYVDRINLGICSIRKDEQAAYIMPVWEFFGYISYNPPGVTTTYYKHGSFHEGYIGDSVLCTINALDGTIIDRTGEMYN